MKSINHTSKKIGFTLVEIMVSVAIFTIIITVGMGALVTITRSYQVSQNQKRVHDSLNYAVESMAREIRLGDTYLISPSGGGPITGDGVGDSLGFYAADNRGYVIYSLSSGTIMIDRSGAANAPNGTQPLTDDTQVVVDELRFTVLGTDSVGSGDRNQPLVWIQVKAHAVDGDPDLTTTVQTLVSQRTLDA